MSNATSSGRATRPPAVEGGGGASGQAAGASNSKSSYVPFTPEEDEQLRALVEAHCESQGADAKPQWNLIAEKMPNRTGKSCRLRWINQLRDDLKKGGFTPEEDLTIMLGHAKHGNRWTLIAKDLPGRTDNAVKNRWHSTLHKRAQQQTELQQHLASAARLAADAGQAHGAALLTSLAQHAAKRPDLASQLHAKLLGSAPATNASSSTGVDAPALAASGGLGNGDGAGGRADGLVSGPTRGVGAARESSPGSAAGAGGGARRSAAGGGGGGGMGIEELMALIMSVAPPGGDACDAAGAAAADLLDASAMAPALAPGAEQGGTQAAQEGGALPGRAAGGPRAGAGGGVGGPASRPPRVRHSATATPATASAGQVRKAAHRSQRLEAEEQAAGTGRASSGRASAESGQNVHERDRLALVVAAPSGLPPMPAVSAGAAGKALAARASTALTTPAALPPPQQTEEAMGVLTVPQPQPLPQPSQPPEPGCSATCSGHSVSRPLPPPPSLHLTPAGDVPASPTSAYTTEKGLLAALPTGLAALLTRITPEELSLWAQLKADDLPTLAVPPLQQEQRDGQQQQRGEGKARAWDGGCYLEPSAAPLPIAGSLLFGAQTAGTVTSLEVAVEAPGRAADGTSGPMAVTIDDPHESAVPDSAAGVVRRALPGKRTAAAVALAEELNEELGTEDEEDEEGDEEADQEEEEEEEEEPAVRPVSKRRRRGESAPMDTGPPALPPAGTGEHGAAASGATRLHPLPPALPLSQAPAGVASAPPVHATGTHPPWGQGAATLPIHGPTPPPPPTQAGLPAGPALMPPHTPQPLPDLPSLSLIWDLGFRAWLASGGADGLAAPAPHLAAPCSYPAAPHLHPQPHGMGTHGPMAASAPHLHPQPHASMAASAPHLLAAIESALGPWGASDPQLLSLITRGGPWAHQPSPALAPPPQQPPHAAGGLHCSAPYGGGASAAHAMEMKAHPGMPLHYHPDALHHQQPPQQHPQPAHHPSRNTPSLSSASHAALAQLFSSQQHLPQLPWEAQPDAAMPNPEGSGMLPGMVAGPVPRVESAAMLGTPLNGSLGELMSMWAAAGAHAAPGGLFPAAAPPADPPADTLAGAGGLPPHAGPGGFPGMEGMGFPAASVSLAQAAMTGMDRPAGSLSPPAMPPHDGAPGLRRSGSFPVAPHQAGLPGSWPPSLAGSLGDLLALVAPGGPPTTPPTSPAGQY